MSDSAWDIVNSCDQDDGSGLKTYKIGVSTEFVISNAQIGGARAAANTDQASFDAWMASTWSGGTSAKNWYAGLPEAQRQRIRRAAINTA